MKATKTLLTFTIVVLAVIQAPFIYYYGDGMFGFLATIPYVLISFVLTIVLIRLLTKHKESSSTMHYIGLSVAVTLGLVSLYPNGQYFEALDWKYRLKERKRIVEDVRQGKLQPNVKYNNMICKLPTNYVPEISDGGNEIAIFKETNSLAVEFYIYRGILDNYSAFRYTDDIKETSRFDSLIRREGNRRYRKLAPNWYRVSY